jgi:hypothetical protein
MSTNHDNGSNMDGNVSLDLGIDVNIGANCEDSLSTSLDIGNEEINLSVYIDNCLDVGY